MQTALPQTEIKDLIEQRRWSALREYLARFPGPELADLLGEMDKSDRALLFRLMPRELSAEMFSYLEPDSRDDLLIDLTDQETRQLLASLSPDDRTELLAELPGQVTQRMLNLLSPEDLREARELLGYPEESVGRLMTPDYVAVRPEWTIGRALEHIRHQGRDSETINVVYVVDESWKLLDALDLRRFILTDPTNTVEQIMDYSFVAVAASEDREEAVRLMQRYDLIVLPVVDSAGVLLGIVTIDDVIDVAQEEATEDFQRTASVAPLRVSYNAASVWTLYSKRIGWLAVLMLVNLFSSGVIAAFEETLAAVVALAFFIPLIIDTGGNAGTQSAIIMVRALSTGDVKLNQWLRTFLRELAIGLLIGVTLGVLGMGLGIMRDGFTLGIVVFLTMVTMLLITNLLGMSLPFLLTRLNLDPAAASGPLITSIADIVGLAVYFTIATRLLVGG